MRRSCLWWKGYGPFYMGLSHTLPKVCPGKMDLLRCTIEKWRLILFPDALPYLRKENPKIRFCYQPGCIWRYPHKNKVLALIIYPAPWNLQFRGMEFIDVIP
jgi:hypothetical protein